MNKLDVLKDMLPTFPTGHGIYTMRDVSGTVVYIGKAKNLQSRLRSYFNGSDGRPSIPHLMKLVDRIETIATENERQSLVLEAELIRKFKPKFNIRLKDDKAYYFVRIDRNLEFPRIELTRYERKDGADYFGPYPYSRELFAILSVIKQTIPLRTCSDAVLRNRVRPCLEYQIKRCLAPCCLEVDRTQYRENLDQAISMLRGNTEDAISHLRERMISASENLQFEEAARLRDRLVSLEKTKDEPFDVGYRGLESRDAFSIFEQGSSVGIGVVNVRNGRMSGGESYIFENCPQTNSELLSSFLVQYYSDDIPDEIIVSVELDDSEVISEFLTERKGRKVSIKIPEGGSGLRLLALAHANARENIRASNEGGELSCVALKEALGLQEIPRLIACSDISHLQGTSVVGGIVVFKDGYPSKENYRKFHLSVEQNDDFANMEEIIRRWVAGILDEGIKVDLLVIDGGPPQLAKIHELRDELNIPFPIISLAKKREKKQKGRNIVKPERVYLEVSDKPIVLQPGSAALNLLENLRDEAHRYAITFHRKVRTAKAFRSVLLDIPGVGEATTKKLLKAYGSINSIKSKGPMELSQKVGISESMAEKIINFLKDN